MIQKYFQEEAAKVIPELDWTYDYYTADDNGGTAYYEGGPPGDNENELGFRFPQYMILVRSSDWDLAEYAIQEIKKRFHKQMKQKITLEVKRSKNSKPIPVHYEVLFIESMAEPIRVGIVDDVAHWSVNFQVTLREEK